MLFIGLKRRNPSWKKKKREGGRQKRNHVSTWVNADNEPADLFNTDVTTIILFIITIIFITVGKDANGVLLSRPYV